MMTHPSGQNDNAGGDLADSLENEHLVHIHIEQDLLKPISQERQHEQNVAIYDLLDENSFSVKNQSGPYQSNNDKPYYEFHYSWFRRQRAWTDYYSC